MLSSAATSIPRSVPHSATQDLLIALVNLSPIKYNHLQNGLRNNYSLACAINVARQANFSLKLCEKVTKTLSFAKEDLQEAQHCLRDSLNMIIDILH